MGATSWGFLLIGSLAAVGAALVVGTLGALVRYHRTGTLPGPEGSQSPVTRGQVAALWARVVLGLALTGLGVWLLARLELI